MNLVLTVPNLSFQSSATSVAADARNLSEMNYMNDMVEMKKKLQVFLETDMYGCDAKWTIFVATALSYRYRTHLIPCPERFLQTCDNGDTELNVDELWNIIESMPKLNIVLQYLQQNNCGKLNFSMIELLYWVLMGTKTSALRTLKNEEPGRMLYKLKKDLHEDCNSHLIPNNVFEVCPYTHNGMESAFMCIHIETDEIQFLFFGAKLDQFWQIINTGFTDLANAETDAITFHTELGDAMRQSTYCPGWGGSNCGPMICCVGICEVPSQAYQLLLHPQCSDTKTAARAVFDIEKVKLRYLLFYAAPIPEPTESDSMFQDSDEVSQSSEYSFLSIWTYFILVGTIAVATKSKASLIKAMFTKIFSIQ